jgi:hypothetical protein
MAEATPRGGRNTEGWVNYALGLVVFLLGIALLLAAFYCGYTMLREVDAQARAVQSVPAASNPAAPAPAKPGTPAPHVVQAVPTPPGGPTLLQFAAAAVVKLVLLLVLAAIGAMTASRGAHLAGMRGN